MSKKNRTNTSKDNVAPSLLGQIFVDTFIKHWFLTLLILIVVISSMQKARTSHDARRATAELQKLKDEYQNLQLGWQSLNLEMTALSESDRLAQIAEKKLKMIKVKTSNEKIISL